MKILFLSRWFPYPIDNGAKLRVYHLLRGLAQAHEVHLIAFGDDPLGADTAHLQQFCASVRVVQWYEFQPNSGRALAGLFSPLPRSIADQYSKEMEREIREALERERFGLVIMSEWQMMAYRWLADGVPVLLEEIEVGLPFGKRTEGRSAARRLFAGLTWWKHRRFLAGLLTGDTPGTVVSEQERDILLREVSPGHRRISVIPNGVSMAEYSAVREIPQPGSLIFTGSFRYRPNYDAMAWFLEEIFPLVREQIPGARLIITGDPAGLALPRCEGVTQTGFVDDIRPLIARSWASVVPLRSGGGTRLKILEAMGLGTPVVSTSKGAEGLEGRPGEHLLVADEPAEFARRIIELMHDGALRERLSASARELVCSRYDWQVILPQFLEVVENAAGVKPRAAG